MKIPVGENFGDPGLVEVFKSSAWVDMLSFAKDSLEFVNQRKTAIMEIGGSALSLGVVTSVILPRHHS